MNIVVFDLETQNLFEDVGGRSNIGALKVSCAVTWSSVRNDFTVYWEKDVPALIAELKSAGRVIGFNIKGFDYEVLRPYAPNERLQFLPTLDIMDDLFHTLSFRPAWMQWRVQHWAIPSLPAACRRWNGGAPANWKSWLNTAKWMWM